MAKVGRNAPCPCGSGKKYKKCCLGKDQELDRRTTPPPPPQRPSARLGESAIKRRIDETLDLLNEIFGEGRDMLLYDEYHVSMAMFRELGYDANRLMYGNNTATDAIVKYALLGSATLTPRVAALREELLEYLTPHHRSLHDALRTGHFGVFDLVQHPHLGELTAIDTTSDGSPAFPLDNAIRTTSKALKFGRNRARGVVGWVFEHRGLALILMLGQLDPEGRSLVEEAAEQWPRSGRQESTEVVRDILSALVDPNFRFRRRRRHGPRVHRRQFQEAWFDDESWLWEHSATSLVFELREATDDPIVLRRQDGQIKRLRWIREMIALADSGVAVSEKVQMADLLGFIRAFRDDRVGAMIERYDLNAVVDSTSSEKKVPLSKVLGAFGLRPDGTLIHFDEESLLRRPASVLLLEDDHPLWATLPRAAPIAAALQWAAEAREKGSSSEIETACQRLKIEERWLATYVSEGDESLVNACQPRYNELLHAFSTIYDEAILETPLDELGLTAPGAMARLTHAVHQKGREVQAGGRFCVRNLPLRREDLLRAQNYGGVTHRRLVDCLEALSREWRIRRSGTDPAILGGGGTKAKGTALIKEGLDELAALFEVE